MDPPPTYVLPGSALEFTTFEEAVAYKMNNPSQAITVTKLTFAASNRDYIVEIGNFLDICTDITVKEVEITIGDSTAVTDKCIISIEEVFAESALRTAIVSVTGSAARPTTKLAVQTAVIVGRTKK